jgi:ATP-dependent Clp protease ATP-binding subunit ClpC
VLARRRKNNPVLIGEAGVGKTAIVEGLAQRIVNHEVPEVLRDKRVVGLNLNSLVAGSKYRGEFEERIKNVVDEIVEHKDELVVFIDEIHTIAGAGAGGDEGGLDAANVMKPALARGELHLIGATTLNEYQKYIEKDAALERRFQPVFIDEPTVIQTIEILRGLRDTYEAHHKVRISDGAVVAAAELSDRYITNRFLPDKAIDLLDQAAARIRIRSKSRPPDLQELEATIGTRKREMDYLSSRKRFDEAQALKDEIEELEGRLEAGTDEWRTEVGTGSTEVTAEDVAEIVSSLTGIPVAELTAEEREKLVGMEQRLHERVIGQEEAVRAVSDAVRRSRAGLTEGARPIATLLFLGPTGVGKTELARALAWTVFGDEDAMIRIDMSEYMERHAVSRLVGAPPGYVGYDEGGQLTERVRRRPYAVVLLDEIEKAHPDVHNVLLQVFDDGRLTDGKGRTVDFTNTVIIATSNVGADLIQENLRQASQGGGLGYDELKEQVSERLRSHFRPEFLNRIDEIVLFHALDQEQIRQIVELTLSRLERTARGQGVDLVWEESLLEHLAEAGYQPEYGARETPASRAQRSRIPARPSDLGWRHSTGRRGSRRIRHRQ